MSDFSCDWSIDDFTATAIRADDKRLVRVQGTGTCPTTGYEVTVTETTPGIVPTPQRIYLRLVERAPEVGGDALTPVSIDETFEISDDVTEIEIRRFGVLGVTEPEYD